MDAKNSPLALLAQTCSQIGSDNSNGVKALLSADKQKAQGGKMENAKSPTAAQKLIMDSSRNTNSSSPGSTKSPPMMTQSQPKNGLNKSVDANNNNHHTSSSNSGSDTPVKLAFKPYENEVLAGKPFHTKSGSARPDNGRRSAENNSSGGHHQAYDQRSEKCHSPSTGNESMSGGSNNTERKCPSNRSSTDENRTSAHNSASPYTTSQASPILRPGLESMPTDYSSAYKLPQLSSPYGSAGMNPLAFPPGMDPQELLMNPAFRPPYATGYPSQVAPSSAAAAAASMMGYHPALSPYFGFGAAAAAAAAASIKPSSGAPGSAGECKDPNCTGCTYSAAAQHHHHQQLMYMAAIQSNHQMQQLQQQHQQQQQGQQRPMQCNWINGDSYCGKKFGSGEELMHHLKTHTAGLSDPTAAAAALIQAQLQPNHAALGLPPPGSMYPSSSGMPSHRGYRTPPPLSPMSAAAMRYHPYAAAAAAAAAVSGGKGGSPLPPMPPSSYSSFNPAMFSPYAYSPYAFYGQRSAVHQ